MVRCATHTPAPRQVISVTPAESGNAAVAADSDGVFILYLPSPGFSGKDSFTYTITDPSGLKSTAAVSVTVLQGSTCGSSPECSGHGLCVQGR